MGKIIIDDNLQREIDRECQRTGQNQEDFIQDALKRKLWIQKFEGLREQAIPYGEAAGYFTDEDVFRDVS